jgi:hypothetical protein
MLLQTLLLALALTSSATADFLISNSTTCQGIPTHCIPGAQVITSANNTDYTCSNLVSAQDNTYLRNGTIGHFGDWHLWSSNVCGHSTLKFEKKADGDGYYVKGEEGASLGTCRSVEKVADVMGRTCDLWVTMVTFRTAFVCESTVCED